MTYRRSLATAAALVAALCVTAGRASAVPNVENARSDANWIKTSILTSGQMAGAIAYYPDAPGLKQIRPYFANYAAFGLIQATAATGDSQYVNAAWDYLTWYGTHMDAAGYVHDWDLVNGTWVQGGYDSTDSYAATFLMAVRAAYRVSGNTTKLQSLSWPIQVAISIIHSTQQSDGLTWATPAWHMKYAEDAVESYQGLLAGQSLANTLGLTSTSTDAGNFAYALLSGLGTMWNSSNNTVYWAKAEDGTLSAPDWTVLSPDIMAQGWQVSYKTATGTRASIILSQIDSHMSNWDQPASHGNNYDVTAMGWGYYFTGNESRAQLAATHIRSAAMTANRAWPFMPQDAGALIILETDGEDILF